MNTIDWNALKDLGKSSLPFGIGTQEDAVIVHAPSGTLLYPWSGSDDVPGAPGDMLVTYWDQAETTRRFHQAIRALDLDTGEEAVYLEQVMDDTLRVRLARRLEQIKLWNHPPMRRDAIKNARTFLKQYVTQNVPHGKTRHVPQEEIDAFLGDPSARFGVAAYYYRTGKPTQQAAERIAALKHAAEERIATWASDSLTAVKKVGEEMVEKVQDIPSSFPRTVHA